VRCVRDRLIAWIAMLFVASSAFAGDGRVEPEFVQPQANFEKAIRNESTMTYIVFATVVNDRTGEYAPSVWRPIF
jgi:hypothetical protein